MKKRILSLAALCMLTFFSSANLYLPFNNHLNSSLKLTSLSGMKVNSVFSLITLTPITYRNLKSDAGYIVIDDSTMEQRY